MNKQGTGDRAGATLLSLSPSTTEHNCTPANQGNPVLSKEPPASTPPGRGVRSYTNLSPMEGTGPDLMELEAQLCTKARLSEEKKGGQGKQKHLLLLLGKALDFLSDPAHRRATLLLLGQHGHHGLCEQVCVLPVAHHLLEDGRETEFRSQ